MADLAQNLINNYMQRKSAESKQATIDTLTGLGSTQAPQAPDLAANSYIGMFGKGMEGLINFAQTGDRNRAAAAEQARLDEATAYERERNAFNDALATRTAEREDKQLDINEKDTYSIIAARAYKQKEDDILKTTNQNTAKQQLLFNQKANEVIEPLRQQQEAYVSKYGDYLNVKDDGKGGYVMALKPASAHKGDPLYEKASEEFNTVSKIDLSAERKKIEKEFSDLALTNKSDKNRYNDFSGLDYSGGLKGASPNDMAKVSAAMVELDQVRDKGAQAITGSNNAEGKQWLTDYQALGGNLKDAEVGSDAYIASLKDEEQNLEARDQITHPDAWNHASFKGWSDVDKKYVLGKLLKDTKGQSHKDPWYDAYSGEWSHNRIMEELPLYAARFEKVKDQSDKLYELDKKIDQKKKNFLMPIQAANGRINLIKLVDGKS